MALPLIGLGTGAPFSLNQITGGAFLPSDAGPWKCAIVAGPESPLDDQFHEPDHGTGALLVDSSFAVR